MGRILAVDPGKKRIGLAVTDELKILASPLAVLPNTPDLYSRIRDICRHYGVTKIIVGYPYSSTYQESMRASEEFGQKLLQETGLPTEFFREEYSTFLAESELKNLGVSAKKRKDRIDKFAAQKILTDYLKSLEIPQT